MALDTRLIGKALGLADPVDVAGVLEPAMQKGEKIFAEQRARREREQVRARQEQIRQENNTAKAVGLLQNIDESGVAANLRPYIMKNALNIRNEALEKIKAAKTPAEKLTATMEANAKIGSLAAQSSDFNNYLKNFADLKPEDISKLNQEGLGEQITAILDGKYEVTTDGKFNFGNGKIVDFSQVVNTNYINKRSDKYLELLKIADNVGTKYGLAGTSNGFFKDKLQNSLSTVEMSDLDLMSVAVDHFGIEDFNEIAKDKIGGNLLERVKEDFDADGDIDDVALRTQLREAINGRIQAASETVFGKAKAEYNKKVNIKNKKEDSFIKNEADKIYKTLIKATGPAQTGTGDLDKGLFVNKKLFGGYVIDSKDNPIRQDGNMLAIPLAVGKEDVEYKEIDLSNYNEVDNLMRELLVQKYGTDANTDAILRIMPQVIGEFDPNWQMGGTTMMPTAQANDNTINTDFSN
jgi:hypothetical protein